MTQATRLQFFKAKRLLAPLVLTGLYLAGLYACNDNQTVATEKTPDGPKKSAVVATVPSALPYVGRWARTFKAGAAAKSEQTATYDISPTQIHYSLTGPITSADYVVNRDWFNEEQEKIVGHSDDGKHYVIFIRNASTSQLTLYKQPVDDLNAGKQLPVPSAETQEHHGWNTYQKQEIKP